MKRFKNLLWIVLLLPAVSFADCTVTIDKINKQCDDYGSYCLDFSYINNLDKDYKACIWDSGTPKGERVVLCLFAERNYSESFKNQLIGKPKSPTFAEDLKAACLTDKDADELF